MIKEWIKVLDNALSLKVLTKTLPTTGNLVYEYNPFRNYRLTQNMYEFKDSLYSLYDLYTIYGLLLDLESGMVVEEDTNTGSKTIRALYKAMTDSGYYNYIAGTKTVSTISGDEGEPSDPTDENDEDENDEDEKYDLVTNLVEELEYCYTGTNNASKKSFEAAIIDCRFKSWNEDSQTILSTETDPILRESGELVDFITDELNFSLENPVNIVPQYSYDGSVNLILNDGVNIPRLINSRFSATGRNTYEIVDRKGDNDTNIYDQGEQFDIDTSLYKRTTKIPKLTFGGVIAGGSLPVGNYHFYFKYADADGNETDFIAESGLVSVFIGYSSPNAIHTGVADENSVKSVKFYMENIDASYNYVYVYYTRNTADTTEESNTRYCKIDKKFTVNNAQQCNILITGYEVTIDISSEDINLQYNVASAVTTAVECQNMLMMGNIHKPDIPYNELADLSLRFLPYVKEVTYTLDIDQNYTISSNNKGYYDPTFIYNSVGYWGGEYYRFGIVYIMPNNDLSPVFNIRGRTEVYPFRSRIDSGTEISAVFAGNVNDGQYNHYNLFKTNSDGVEERNYISINESTFYTLTPEDDEGVAAIDGSHYENSKGVVTLHPNYDTNTIYALDIRVDDDVLQELKKYVKGYFFVRQERMPTILCQGITIGLDINAHTPTIPTCSGFLEELADSLDESTYVEVDDINDVNYISEGFMTRYSFSLEKKSTSLWKKIGMAIAAVAIAAVAVVATVVTCGAALVAAGIVAATVMTSAITTTALVSGIALSATIAVGLSAGIHGTIITSIVRNSKTKKLEGRHTEIPSGYYRKETDDSRLLSGTFRDRVIIMDPTKNTVSAVLCPDYEVNQAYFNQIFTGNQHLVKMATSQSTNRLQGYSSDFFFNDENHFYIPSYYDIDNPQEYLCKIQGVPDSVAMIGIDTYKFRSRAGFPEEAWHYEAIGQEWEEDDKKINADIIRGSFGPYLAIVNYPKNPCDTINIMVPGYEDMTIDDLVFIRMDDSSSYYPISDRYAMEDSDDQLIEPLTRITGSEDRSCGYSWELYRGDCYICQVTHRLNRNFNDPSAPYNDRIVDDETWKDNYNPDKTEKYADINLGDVNAVRLGMWCTFRVRSTYNLNIRTVDNSNVDEKLMCGHGRGYYPYLPMDTEGCYKTPESDAYNDGFKKSVSERYNFALPDVPYIKNWFGTRIMYSDIHVNDAYKNGFRTFRGNNYIDCPRTYGEIVKLISVKASLVVIFEHGIGVITVNSAEVKEDVLNNNVINTNNVLSAPTIISDTLGSQWADSILKTSESPDSSTVYIYGVDTVAKKIWRTNGSTVQVISDLKVGEFLNNNISLGERELTPIMGIRNVKTFYNAFKRDVLFTFYDNLSGFEEKVWNLCWNEVLEKFVTFYSWVPSYMENINNIPFSFNRNTSKWIAKLGVSHADNSFADGITLTNNIMENSWTGSSGGTDATSFKAEIMQDNSATLIKTTMKPGDSATKNTWCDTTKGEYKTGLVGILGIIGVNLPSGQDIIYKVDYSLERDNFLNYKNFEIKEIGYYTHQYNSNGDTVSKIASINEVHIPVYGLYLKSGVSVEDLATEMYYRNKAGNCYADWESNKIKVGDSSEITDSDGKTTYVEYTMSNIIKNNYPIYKDRYGKRLTLDRSDMINPTHIVRLLNIKATIYGYYGGMDQTVQEYFYNYARENSESNDEEKATQEVVTSDSTTTTTGQWVDCGYYESVVAVIPRWNMQFLSTDFWKHGQAGLIDIADKIYPAYWYGEQHPFEFEFVVVNDASIHKIFTNLEIVSNNVKPESFHFEIVGDVYDFAKDKVNMYFRQEAMKALYQYNGADILYNENFLETQPKQQKRSADLPHEYYARYETFNEIYDSYKQATAPNKNYDHINGSEIVYYENLREYRIWTHQKAVSLDDFEGDSTSKSTYIDSSGNTQYVYEDDNWEGARALIASNCKYQEDRWRVVINPIVICFRNEYNFAKYKSGESKAYLTPSNSLWTDTNRPPLPVFNSPLPLDDDGERILSGENATISNDDFPPCLKDIGYTVNDLDNVRWLDDVDIHGYSWGGEGTACNREEVEIRDKFVKIRIRYTGDQLAVISLINTIYQLSLA